MLFRNLLLILGTLTLIAAAALAVLWIKMPSTAPSRAQTAAAPAAILVAVSDIPAGALLRPAQVRWKIVAPAMIGATDLVQGRDFVSAYYGAVVRHAIASGQRLTDSDLVQASSRTFLAAVLSPGMLAVSLSVDDSQSVSGLVQPGDYVDVILAPAGQGNVAASSVGQTVLRNVRIVAVDQLFNMARKKPAAPADAGTPKMPKEVTLELTDLDARRLLGAVQLGRVSLVLRALEGRADARPATTPAWGDPAPTARDGGTSARRLSGAMRQTVQIIRGSKITTQ